jgi:hypothetical protein
LRWWSAVRPGRFTPGKGAPGTHRMGGPHSRSGQRGKNSWCYRDSNSDPSFVQPVASRYTDCAVSTIIYLFFLGRIFKSIEENTKNSDCRSVFVIIDFKRTPKAEFVGICMIYLHAKLHVFGFLYLEQQNFLVFGIMQNCLISWRIPILYKFTRMAIKLTVVIIVGYHCYQLDTKFYPLSFSLGSSVSGTVDLKWPTCRVDPVWTLSSQSPYIDELILDHQCGFRCNR